MNYIKDLIEGQSVTEIYLCKKKTFAITKNGKEYINVLLQDKTGTIEAKIWEPDSPSINDFDNLDYVSIIADIGTFNGAPQLTIRQLRKANAGEYDESEYSPTTEKDIDEMYTELLSIINSINNEYLKALLDSFFVNNDKFIKRFKLSSAAKTVHHATIGGLLEHTLSVTKICDFISNQYTNINRDLLITSAICHDIGKVKEFSTFPENDYTDDGNLLGHIYMGAELINEHARRIENFPKPLLLELKHCILSHHGELEYGSPKKPSLIEAVALTYADNMDAKLYRMSNILNELDDTDNIWTDKADFFLGSRIKVTSK